MDHDWAARSRELDRRLDACMALPFQVRGEPHVRLRDPLTGGRALLNPARAVRTRPASPVGADGCPYCQGRTPPTLFYVRDAGVAGAAGPPDAAGSAAAAGVAGTAAGPGTRLPGGGCAAHLVVENEQESLAVAAGGVAQEGGHPWVLLDRLGETRRPDAAGRLVPVTHPAEPWLARVFLNATPIVSDPASAANGFVVSVPAPYHGLDLAPLATGGHAGSAAAGAPRAGEEAARGGPVGALPGAVIEALVTCWALLEAWGDLRGLVSVPFVNGGKDRVSGQSVDCFHGQLVSVGRQDRPPLVEGLSTSRPDRCGLCSLVGDESWRVVEVGDVVVAMHPAPRVECSLLIFPAAHVAGLRELPDLSLLARAISLAAHCLASLLGGLPPYNLFARIGVAVGHWHLEMVPRARVSMVGGFEFATGFSVLTRDPREMAARCRAHESALGAGLTAGRAAGADPGLVAGADPGRAWR